jgi:hypothetical protein
VVFVHAKAQEEKFVADGFGVKRNPVMYNDFVLIGPKNDPAGVSPGLGRLGCGRSPGPGHPRAASIGVRSGGYPRAGQGMALTAIR